MKNEIKKILTYIGVFLAGIFTSIVAILLHNRRTTDEVRAELSDAIGLGESIERTESAIADTVDGVGTTVDGIADTTDRLAETLESGREIFTEIRKQKLD